MRLRTLVVDDEAIPRRRLCSMVAGVDWLELIGTVPSGAAAAAMIDGHEPDLVFLDIKLPDISGLDVIQRTAHRPHVVFTTAYDEYAIRALQLGALDYLLKPFGRRRFLQAARRVRQRLADAPGPGAEPRRPPSHPALSRRILVRDRDDVIPVAIDQVQRVAADGDSSALHVQSQRLLAPVTLGELEAVLDPQRFLRVHRSHIVNLDWVASFRPYDARRFLVVMRDGFTLIASRAGTQLLKGRMI